VAHAANPTQRGATAATVKLHAQRSVFRSPTKRQCCIDSAAPACNALLACADRQCPAVATVLQLLIFLRAHQLLSEHNHQCVMALTPTSSPVLVTQDSCSGNSAALPALLLERVTRLLESKVSTQQQNAGAHGVGSQYSVAYNQQIHRLGVVAAAACISELSIYQHCIRSYCVWR
jgi:hypothetical protein